MKNKPSGIEIYGYWRTVIKNSREEKRSNGARIWMEEEIVLHFMIGLSNKLHSPEKHLGKSEKNKKQNKTGAHICEFSLPVKKKKKNFHFLLNE